MCGARKKDPEACVELGGSRASASSAEAMVAGLAICGGGRVQRIASSLAQQASVPGRPGERWYWKVPDPAAGCLCLESGNLFAFLLVMGSCVSWKGIDWGVGRFRVL